MGLRFATTGEMGQKMEGAVGMGLDRFDRRTRIVSGPITDCLLVGYTEDK